MSVTYKKDEILSTTTVAKSFGKVLSNLENHKIDKVIVAKNNKLEAVILSIDDYENMAELYNIMEHMEIYQIIKKRLLKHDKKRVELDTLLKEEKIEI
jgi:PHD/YefM family antitoxin component YafN of YafNO toxin-antitoxin module